MSFLSFNSFEFVYRVDLPDLLKSLHFFFFSSRSTEDFEILHGDPQCFPDTICFLKSLVELDAVYETENNAEKRQTREQKAAAGLFNWEVFLISIYFIFFTSPPWTDLSP